MAKKVTGAHKRGYPMPKKPVKGSAKKATRYLQGMPMMFPNTNVTNI